LNSAPAKLEMPIKSGTVITRPKGSSEKAENGDGSNDDTERPPSDIADRVTARGLDGQ